MTTPADSVVAAVVAYVDKQVFASHGLKPSSPYYLSEMRSINLAIWLSATSSALSFSSKEIKFARSNKYSFSLKMPTCRQT
jgi:hypothetical protein